MEKSLLREREIPARYPLSICWLRKARHLRRGPRFVRIGRMIFYRTEDLEAFLAACTVGTADQKADSELHQCTST